MQTGGKGMGLPLHLILANQVDCLLICNLLQVNAHLIVKLASLPSILAQSLYRGRSSACHIKELCYHQFETSV